MRRYHLLWVFVLLAWPTVAGAHGIPIILSGEDDKLQATPLVLTSEFERLAGVLLTTDLPGFGIETKNAGIDIGTDVQMQVISKLWYWNPALQIADDTESTLTIENTVGDSAVVNKDTTTLPPISIGAYDGSDGWHKHLDYFLDPLDSPAGAYGLLFEVLAEPLVKSDPVLVVFGNYGDGFGEEDMAAALAGLQRAIFTLPGDANRDGTVDLTDFGILKQNFGLMPATWEQGNFDDDPSVTLSDFGVLKANFGKTSQSGAAAAVPEPSAWMLMLTALVFAGLHSTRHHRR